MGFWEGASSTLPQGFGLGAKMYQDLQNEKKLAAQQAEAKQRQDYLDQRADSDRVNKDYQFEQEMALKRQALNQKPGAGAAGMPMTPGRKSADMAFGKDYVDFSTTGRPTAERGIAALSGAKEELKANPSVSGPLRGLFPDAIRSFTNPEAVAIKERIRGSVQNTLRATLGSAFTEKEGERIFNNAYNDRLPVEENLRRVEAVLTELQAQTDAKENMGQYFEETGTLTGYDAMQGGAKKKYQIISVE